MIYEGVAFTYMLNLIWIVPLSMAAGAAALALYALMSTSGDLRWMDRRRHR